MVVTVDVDRMLKLGLTPNEYVLLLLIQNKGHASAKRLIQKVPFLDNSTMTKLVSKRLIHNLNKDGELNIDRIFLRSKFTEEVNKDDLFDELLSLFPNEIVRPDGTRDYLKTNLNNSRKLYSSIVRKDEVLHKYIMACLSLEVAERTKTNKLMYMKRLYKWLSTEEWKAWQSQLTETKDVETLELGYGLKLE